MPQADMSSVPILMTGRQLPLALSYVSLLDKLVWIWPKPITCGFFYTTVMMRVIRVQQLSVKVLIIISQSMTYGLHDFICFIMTLWLLLSYLMWIIQDYVFRKVAWAIVIINMQYFMSVKLCLPQLKKTVW